MSERPEAFLCPVCGWSEEAPKHNYTHCPNCLSSIHEDKEEDCGGTWQPVSVWVRPDGSWQLIRRCSFCGELETVDLQEEDSPVTLLSIAGRPLANPPFPIERIEQLTRMMGGSGNMGGYTDEP